MWYWKSGNWYYKATLSCDKCIGGFDNCDQILKTYYLHKSEIITLHPCDSKLQAYQINFISAIILVIEGIPIISLKI